MPTAWISHRLRLLGQVSHRAAQEAFGITARQFRRWMAAYDRQNLRPFFLHTRAARGSGAAHNPIYRAQPRDYLDGRADLDERAAGGTMGQRRLDPDGELAPIADSLVLSTGQALDLLDTLRGHCLLARFGSQASGHDTSSFLHPGTHEPFVVEASPATHPYLSGPYIPVLIQSMVQRTALRLAYTNKAGEESAPLVSVHRFVFSGGKYRLRVFDHAHKRGMDLNPSRIRSAQVAVGEPYISVEADREWHTPCQLIFRCSPQILASPTMLHALALSYPLRGGKVVVDTTLAMAHYVKEEMRGVTLLDGEHRPVLAFDEAVAVCG